jgi:hypothetical protein
MSEEVGKNVAAMLFRDGAISSEVSAQQRSIDLLNWIRARVVAAAQGLNSSFREPVLAVVDRSDGFQFLFRNQLTLVVKVGPYKVGLAPSRSNTENTSSSTFDVSSTADGYEFKGIPMNPTVATFYIAGDKFIEGVIKVACNKHFDAT